MTGRFPHLSGLPRLSPREGYSRFSQVKGMMKWRRKMKTPKKSQGFKQNPRKSLDQNLTPKKSHAEFPSHKNNPESIKWYNMKNRNIIYGMFVFVHSSHHLEWEPFSYLVVIVTTLETSKNILNQLQHKFGFTLSADQHHLHGRDTRELSRIFRLFWIPKSSYQKKYLPKYSYP